ncbi:MAG: GtrA family protein [Micropepsaceae bacterium]
MSDFVRQISSALTSSSPLRFVVVGVSNAALSYAVFQICFATLDIAWISQAIGYAAGIGWSFFWNSLWTFKTGALSNRRFVRFVGTQVAFLVLSSSALGFTVDRMGWNSTVSWLAIMAVVTTANYVVSRNYVFAAEDRAR